VGEQLTFRLLLSLEYIERYILEVKSLKKIKKNKFGAKKKTKWWRKSRWPPSINFP
jgi:hypothetical protein